MLTEQEKLDMKREQEQPNYIFKVPNDWWGRMFITLAKRYINRKSYQLSIMGRELDKVRAERDGLTVNRQNLPHAYCKSLAVYLVAKIKDDKNITYPRTVGIHTEYWLKRQLKHGSKIHTNAREGHGQAKAALIAINNTMVALENVFGLY